MLELHPGPARPESDSGAFDDVIEMTINPSRIMTGANIPICHGRPSARLILWYGIGMREKASVLSDLSNVLGAVGLSLPKRVLKKMTFQYAEATRQVGRFFQERPRITNKWARFDSLEVKIPT